MNRLSIGIIGGLLVLAALSAAQGLGSTPWRGEISASELTTGRGQTTVWTQGEALQVFTFNPGECAPSGVLVVIHGLNRKAERARDGAVALAERQCLVVVAPLFDKDRFPNWRFHRAGTFRSGQLQPPERWTGAYLSDLVDWAQAVTGEAESPVYLFGHSAGAQFLSRIAAYMPPEQIDRFVIANPSVHVFADPDMPAPYGFGGIFPAEDEADRLRDYLDLSITLLIGQDDTGTRYLANSAAARAQGEHRLERARNAFRTAQEQAAAMDWDFNWTLMEVGGIGHSSTELLASEAVLEAFGFPELEMEPAN